MGCLCCSDHLYLGSSVTISTLPYPRDKWWVVMGWTQKNALGHRSKYINCQVSVEHIWLQLNIPVHVQETSKMSTSLFWYWIIFSHHVEQWSTCPGKCTWLMTSTTWYLQVSWPISKSYCQCQGASRFSHFTWGTSFVNSKPRHE